MKSGRALIVVDLQRDFCPGGALPVRNGDRVVEPINKLIHRFEAGSLPIVFTRDWHPKSHCSFTSRGGMWPPHAVRGTSGALFHQSLYVPKNAMIIDKATRKNVEAYSGFQGTNLGAHLERMTVKDLYVVGLATDYCVMNTVVDGIRTGFRVSVVTDCVRGVNRKRTDSATAFRKMTGMGATTTTSQELLKSLSGRVTVSSSS